MGSQPGVVHMSCGSTWPGTEPGAIAGHSHFAGPPVVTGRNSLRDSGVAVSPPGPGRAVSRGPPKARELQAGLLLPPGQLGESCGLLQLAEKKLLFPLPPQHVCVNPRGYLVLISRCRVSEPRVGAQEKAGVRLAVLSPTAR